MEQYALTFFYSDEPLGATYLHSDLSTARKELLATIEDMLAEYREQELDPVLIMTSDNIATIRCEESGVSLTAVVSQIYA